MWRFVEKKKERKQIRKNWEELRRIVKKIKEKFERNVEVMWKCKRPDELKGPKGDDLKRFLSLKKSPRLLDHFSLFGHGIGFFVDNANCWR
ncbi:hypothetical protein QG37_00864 [Candidozyma auris]|uniref:Uncharacterized protein n=1 Tax=Candidozyma auris TaxID=498019 RepID=A0A0L0P832_CANAR|nr:hypothetical protein QG37_00864 [[Candida] auris]